VEPRPLTPRNRLDAFLFVMNHRQFRLDIRPNDQIGEAVRDYAHALMGAGAYIQFADILRTQNWTGKPDLDLYALRNDSDPISPAEHVPLVIPDGWIEDYEVPSESPVFVAVIRAKRLAA
jgi:hypothetical protein